MVQPQPCNCIGIQWGFSIWNNYTYAWVGGTGAGVPCSAHETQEDCETANCFWYDGSCHSTEQGGELNILLEDNFNDNSRDSLLWNVPQKTLLTTNSGCKEQNNRHENVVQASGASWGRCYQTSNGNFPIDEKRLRVKVDVASLPSDTIEAQVFYMPLVIDGYSENWLKVGMIPSTNKMVVIKNVGGTPTTLLEVDQTYTAGRVVLIITPTDVKLYFNDTFKGSQLHGLSWTDLYFMFYQSTNDQAVEKTYAYDDLQIVQLEDAQSDLEGL